MSDTEEEISTEPSLSPAGKQSSTASASLAPSPSLSSPRSWVRPLTAISAIATAVFVTLPKMFHYLDLAADVCRGPSSCDWKDFVPALLCFALSLTAFLPTWIKDSGGLLGAAGGLVDKIRGKK